MSDQGFRRQALHHAATNQFGSSVVVRPARVSALLFVLMVGSAIVFCSQTTLRSSLAVQGILLPSDRSADASELARSNQALEAEIHVPARAASRIRIGQEIRIVYDDFPLQIYGTHVVKVRTIAESMTGGESAQKLGENLYVVRANLEAQSVGNREGERALETGMMFTGNIVTSEQTIWRWIYARVIEPASNL